MTSSPHRASLEQARRNLDRLAAAEREYLATNPYHLAHEHDMRRGRYLVRVQVRRPVPDAIAPLAATVVRALRDSLDALAGALAGRPTRFPIHESLALFAQRARKPIAPMSDEAQAYLEELQPYHAIGGFRNGPLWILRELDASEPSPLVTGSLRGGAMGVNTQRKVTLVGEPAIETGPVSDGTLVASVATKIVGPDPKLDMFFRPDYAFAYAGESAGAGREVVALLGELGDHVERTVFTALEPSLPAHG
jgi:hypothetical protein